MNIALICPYDFNSPSGVVSHTLCLGEALSQLDHQVIYFSPSKNIPPNLKIIHFPLGDSFIINTVNGSQAPLVYNVDTDSLYKLLIKHNVDVIHLQEILYPLSYQIVTAKSMKQFPMVGTTHAFWSKNENVIYAAVGKILHQALVSRINVITTVSKACYQSNPNLLENKFSIIPPAFSPPQQLQTSYPDSWDHQKQHLLFLSRLEKRKGGIHFVRALSFLSSSLLKNCVFHIAGDGPESTNIKQFAQKIPQAQIVFHGQIDDLTKWQYLQHANIYVAPATHGESFGINLYECLAAGTRIIAGNNPGYQETLQNYIYPWAIIDPTNPSLFAQTITKMIHLPPDPHYRQWAHQEVEIHSIQHTVSKYLTCYEQAQIIHSQQPLNSI